MKNRTKFESPGIMSDSIEDLSRQLVNTTNELYKANMELKNAQKERQEMLANISHDLRAPITAIRSSIDYLRSGRNIEPQDLDASLQLIDRRTKNLENLINDMYFLFCVEDTTKELSFEKVSALHFLEEYFYDAIADSKYNKKEMNIDIPDSIDCTILIDVQKMVRVLDNLFTNAAKYSGDGATITLKAEQNDSHLLVYVSDTGIGIPKEAIPHIFNRTYTVSTARTPASPTGSGFGLSIVKAIVERHGGNISCESEEGVGSTFCVTLPVTK